MLRRFLRWCIGWYELAQLAALNERRLNDHDRRLDRLEAWHAKVQSTTIAPLPPPNTSGILVRAKVPGVYGNIRRNVGERFVVRARGEVGTWMEVIE